MPADRSTYLAEERTFLAWIRTGIAMMGFGFVVARFGLFLRELASIRAMPQFQTSALSVPLGTALLVAGVLVNIMSSVRHVRIVRALNTARRWSLNLPLLASSSPLCWRQRDWQWLST